MDTIKTINESGWADFSLQKIEIPDENIRISLSENIIITCCNFIGISYVGHWEEGIIEDIVIESKGDLIDTSLKEVQRNYGKLPYIKEIRQMGNEWYQLNIKMIDGVVIKIACEYFELLR